MADLFRKRITMKQQVSMNKFEIKNDLEKSFLDEREYLKVGANVFYHEEEKENESRFSTKKTTEKDDLEKEKKSFVSCENLENVSVTSSEISLVDILKKNWKEKHKKVGDDISKIEENLIKKSSLEGYLTRKEVEESENKNPTLTKFQQELTEEEKELVLSNMKRQQKNFLLLKQRDRKHKVLKVKNVHPYLSNEEIITSLENDCENEEDCVVRFTTVKLKKKKKILIQKFLVFLFI